VVLEQCPLPAADMKLADLAKEIEALKSLRHERLIRLHAVCSSGEPVYIVTELMGKGNLQAYLGSEYPPPPPPPPRPAAVTQALHPPEDMVPLPISNFQGRCASSLRLEPGLPHSN
jgi:serine/threonine protein kinase